MKPPVFDYATPSSLAEACGLLVQYEGDAKVLSGGQSLVPLLNMRLARPAVLVDLARNDLGRVCDFGTVQVKDLMIIERCSHVMHIVSQVEGRLSEGKTPYDLMRATFPAGTLSGAPKIRAMQIISELEQTARGPYGGCVGYFSFNGNLDCCITIRTALIKDGKAYVQAGGGWVNDSTPDAEFQETVNKSKAMLKAVAMAEGFARCSAR